VYNLAHKFLPHRLQDTAINNIMYAVNTPYLTGYHKTAKRQKKTARTKNTKSKKKLKIQ